MCTIYICWISLCWFFESAFKFVSYNSTQHITQEYYSYPLQYMERVDT